MKELKSKINESYLKTPNVAPQSFFTENLTLSLPVPRWAGYNTDLPWNINISKTKRVNSTSKE